LERHRLLRHSRGSLSHTHAQPGEMRYRGTSLIRNSAPPQDHHRALGIVLLQGPRRRVFLMSEIPLYCRQHRPLQTDRSRGIDGLVFKAHRLVFHSTLGSRVIKKKKRRGIDAGKHAP